MTDWKQAKTHPKFDHSSMRILLTPEQIEALPFKEVDTEELYEVMCTVSFNPPFYYASFEPSDPDRRVVELKEGEVGQDTSYRYILAKPTEDEYPSRTATNDQHTQITTQLKTDLGGLIGCSSCLELIALWLGIAGCLGGWVFEQPAVLRLGVLALTFMLLSRVTIFLIVWVNVTLIRAKLEAHD